MVSVPSLASPRTLREVVRSVSSGTVVSRSAHGQFPLFGSTGQIGWTEEGIYSGSAVLVARVGANAGYVYSVDGRYGVTDNTLIVWPDTTTNPFFVAYYLTFLKLNSMVYGSGQPLITGRILKDLEFPRLSQIEQTHVAIALQDADALILALERLIAKKQAIKQGMMQHLLTGKTRLSGFSDSWTSTALADVGGTVRGVSYDPRVDLFPDASADTLDLLRSNNVQGGLLDLTDVQHVHRRRVRADQVLRKEDILICAANGSKQLVGKAALYQGDGSDCHTFGAFMAIFRTSRREAEPYFIILLMQTKKYREWIDVLLAGSSINNLRPSDIAAFVVDFPNRTEQTAIVQIFMDVDAEIDALRARLVAMRNVKRGMMQELLTGRTRLNPAEATA